MKKRTTAQALFLSVISLMLCVSMLIGTTFAWFTDSVSSARNTIQSGNLDVELYYSKSASGPWTEVDSTTDVFGYDLWEPGYTKVAYFKVVNAGSLALNYQLTTDVYKEEQGVNKAGQPFSLSEYLRVAVVDANVGRDAILAMAGTPLPESFKLGAKELLPTNEEIIGLAIWMPTTVGNEANHLTGEANIPSIEFGINLVATQKTQEIDSFGPDYDTDATVPNSGTGAMLVAPGVDRYEIDIKRAGGSKLGSAIINAASVDTTAEELIVNIDEQDEIDGNVTITSDQDATTYEITVEGLKSGNTEDVEININIGAGLTGVQLYHYDDLITDAHYNDVTGIIRFTAKNFSPFTVVYDAIPEEDDSEEPSESDLPVANVTPYTDTANIEWGNYGQWSPTEGLEANLEAAYTFACKETAEEAMANPYANWNCDFYVSLDRDLGENQIFLGGNYGEFGWIGFHNGDVTLAANEELPLLGSVTQNPWTYAEIADFVGTFICGVGDVNDALAGATFTVKLRLTNPENDAVYHDVATITHTFTGTVGNTAYVDNGEDLQDAVNNGAEEIVLTDDIDLSQGLVIPGLN